MPALWLYPPLNTIPPISYKSRLTLTIIIVVDEWRVLWLSLKLLLNAIVLTAVVSIPKVLVEALFSHRGCRWIEHRLLLLLLNQVVEIVCIVVSAFVVLIEAVNNATSTAWCCYCCRMLLMVMKRIRVLAFGRVSALYYVTHRVNGLVRIQSMIATREGWSHRRGWWW